VTEKSPYLPEKDSGAPPPSPWGFRILVTVAAVYLLLRLVEFLVKVLG
jgi:hypothetical protein